MFISIYNIIILLYIKEVLSKHTENIESFSASPSKSISSYSDESPFPILASSEIPKLSSVKTIIPKSKIVPVGVKTVDAFFATFAYELIPVFSITSTGLQKILDVMESMSR